jgi:hypothetical protein
MTASPTTPSRANTMGRVDRPSKPLARSRAQASAAQPFDMKSLLLFSLAGLSGVALAIFLIGVVSYYQQFK